MRPVWVVGLAAAGALSGCSSTGSSSAQSGPSHSQAKPLPAISCPASLRHAFARGGAAGASTVHPDLGAGLSTCDYRAQARTADACSAATVTINTNPQPFKDFQRWVVETGQNAATGPGENLAPVAIMGIGIEADWVPGTLTFETATNSRWIAIRLTCPGADPKSLTLAEALARAALSAR